MKAIVDTEACIGCGLCVSICEGVFVMDDDGKAEVIGERVPAEFKDQCQQAANDCPVEAIKTIE
jgi:ferredoxin